MMYASWKLLLDSENFGVAFTTIYGMDQATDSTNISHKIALLYDVSSAGEWWWNVQKLISMNI